MIPDNLTVPRGVFSKLFRFKNGTKKTIIYNTPRQSVVMLDGDSAEVWQLIFDYGGDCSKAYEYIIKSGKFNQNKEEEAKTVLASFLERLKKSKLLNELGKGGVLEERVSEKNKITINDRINPLINSELMIGQLMADSHILYSLVLELTYRCNEKCIHCYCPSNKNIKEMPIETIIDLVSQFSKLGGLKIQLTGGEIFIRNDIEDILNIFKSANIVLDITSNLTLMTDSIFKTICDLKPRSVGCSIYSARANLHDKTTGVSGSFKKSVESIKKLRSAGIPVVIKTPLMSHTAAYWKEIEILANDLGCEYQLDLNITAKNDGGKEPLEYRIKDVDLLMEIMSSRFYKLFINDEPMSMSNTVSPEASLCGAGSNGLAISPDGTIRPCIGLSTKIGVFPDNSLEEIWDTSGFFSEWGALKMKNIKKCSDCIKIGFCNRCPGAWQAETGHFDMPIEYACFLAETWSKAQKLSKI